MNVRISVDGNLSLNERVAVFAVETDGKKPVKSRLLTHLTQDTRDAVVTISATENITLKKG